MENTLQALKRHQAALHACHRCPEMIPPVVTGQPVLSPVIAIGQAPGEREGPAGKPFAWTAGKTLFKWFSSIGVDEERFRSHIYMAAVCRCFPGKNPKGGDRVPSREEIVRCRYWLEREFRLLQPRLVIPIGKLAIAETMKVQRLADVVGKAFERELFGVAVTVIPLPHPSGASTWHRTEPGRSLLVRALRLIEAHPAWREAVVT